MNNLRQVLAVALAVVAAAFAFHFIGEVIYQDVLDPRTVCMVVYALAIPAILVAPEGQLYPGRRTLVGHGFARDLVRLELAGLHYLGRRGSAAAEYHHVGLHRTPGHPRAGGDYRPPVEGRRGCAQRKLVLGPVRIVRNDGNPVAKQEVQQPKVSVAVPLLAGPAPGSGTPGSKGRTTMVAIDKRRFSQVLATLGRIALVAARRADRSDYERHVCTAEDV